MVMQVNIQRLQRLFSLPGYVNIGLAGLAAMRGVIMHQNHRMAVPLQRSTGNFLGINCRLVSCASGQNTVINKAVLAIRKQHQKLLNLGMAQPVNAIALHRLPVGKNRLILDQILADTVIKTLQKMQLGCCGGANAGKRLQRSTICMKNTGDGVKFLE